MATGSRFSRIRFRRKLRIRRNQVTQFGEQAETFTERYFFRRLERLGDIKRFVIGWTALFVLLAGLMVGQIRALDGYFQTLQAVPGGIYTGGITGDFTNANPLFASTPVDEAVSKLLFSGLLTYDDNNQLVGDLARSWSIDESGKIYTVKLRPNLAWHDGTPLTSADVLYTYQTIQNPDAQSALNKNWLGITVAAPDLATITFTLPNVLGSFPYTLTNGIVPGHLLRPISPSELRSTSFNTVKPVGSGPFAWQTIEISGETPETREEQIALSPFDGYHKGKPKLSSIVIHAFHTERQMVDSFEKRELTAASFSEIPDFVKTNPDIRVEDFVLSAANMVFYRAGSPIMADVNVRKALTQAADTASVIQSLDYTTRPVRMPFLQGQLGYDKAYFQPGFNPVAAEAILDAAGWKRGVEGGVRSKAGKPLAFTLNVQKSAETKKVTDILRANWQNIGAQVTVRAQDNADLQLTIKNREYDALLYGISIGPDPDAFVYWHSSQNDPRSTRLNLSEYKSSVADASIEAGRTRTDPALRVVKYKPFLQAWQADAPALGLYQPRYALATYGKVYGLNPHIINQYTDRYNNVQEWQIRQVARTNDRPDN